MASKKKANQKKNSKPESAKKTITKVPQAGKETEAAIKKEDLKADKDEKEPKSSRKTGKKKKDKPGFFRRAVDFIKSVVKELKKVSWLTGDELAKSSAVVAVCVGAFTLVIWLMDSGLGAIAAKLITR